MYSTAERFLLDFHSVHAGATTVALGGTPVVCEGERFASSYHLLAARIPQDATRILELACGDGYLLSLLASTHANAQLTGIDMSPHELAAAAARLGERAQLHRCRAQQLPFADATFDAVTSHMALMLMDESEQVLAELRRVLHKGASLTAVVGAGAVASPASELYRSLVLPHLKASASFTPLGDARWRSAEGVRGLLAAAGFEGVAEALVEGELRRTPEGLWDYFRLMYDSHFLDAGTVASLREQFLAGIASHAAGDGTVTLRVAWRLVRALAPR